MGNGVESVLVALFESPLQSVQRHYRFKRHFQAKTPFGFVAPYRLTGLVEVVDSATFYDAVDRNGKSIDKVLDRIVDIFHRDIFVPLLEEGRQFFLYDANDYGQIMLMPWRYDEHPDGSLTVKPCSYYWEEGLHHAVKSALSGFKAFGCVMNVVNFDCLEEGIPDIEENFRMIHPQALAKIREEGLYLQLVEQICIAALSERVKLLPNVKTYGKDAFATVTTQLIGDALKISWKNAKVGEGWQLLGFRRTDGFAANEFSDSENGILVVDSAAAEGATVERALPRNRPVYYTFFLRKMEGRLFSNERYYCFERVGRFSETIPDADTVGALARQLEETRLKVQIAEAERTAADATKGPLTFDEQRRAGMESQLRLAKDALGLLRSVDEIEADALKELESTPDRFPPERAEAWRNEVVDLCARLRENVRRLV